MADFSLNPNICQAVDKAVAGRAAPCTSWGCYSGGVKAMKNIWLAMVESGRCAAGAKSVLVHAFFLDRPRHATQECQPFIALLEMPISAWVQGARRA